MQTCVTITNPYTGTQTRTGVSVNLVLVNFDSDRLLVAS